MYDKIQKNGKKQVKPFVQLSVLEKRESTSSSPKATILLPSPIQPFARQATIKYLPGFSPLPKNRSRRIFIFALLRICIPGARSTAPRSSLSSSLLSSFSVFGHFPDGEIASANYRKDSFWPEEGESHTGFDSLIMFCWKEKMVLFVYNDHSMFLIGFFCIL